jgi:hypothetical protein
MKMNVKISKEAVKPKPTSAGQPVLPFFISTLINGNYFCLDTRDITAVIPNGYRVPGFKGENSLHECTYKTIQGSRAASGRQFKNLSRYGAPSEGFDHYAPGSKCLEKHLSIASLNLWVYGKTHDGRDKKNSLSMRKEKEEFGSFIPDADHLKNKLAITNKTMVIKQITVDSKNLNFYGGSIK